MSLLRIKINPIQRIAYFPKLLVEQFGYELEIRPYTNVALVFSKNKPLPLIIKSVELLLEDLRLRKESEGKEFSNGQQ
jgi:hypothetical protein